jgi:hypothetical protein
VVKEIVTTFRNKYRTEVLRGLHNATLRRLRLLRRPTISPVSVALREVLKNNAFTIVQIGAYTGNTQNDPLSATLNDLIEAGSGRLVCVEPLKIYFDKLVETIAT